MLYVNFNTTKTISHFIVKLTNFNYSDYFKEQNKQNIRRKLFKSFTIRKIIRR